MLRFLKATIYKQYDFEMNICLISFYNNRLFCIGYTLIIADIKFSVMLGKD